MCCAKANLGTTFIATQNAIFSAHCLEFKRIYQEFTYNLDPASGM